MEKISEFDEKCNSVSGKVEQIQNKVDTLDGSLEEKEGKLESLLEEAKSLIPEADALKEPYDELVSLNLSADAKYTSFSIRNEVDSIILKLTRLIAKNKSDKFSSDNKARIDRYNEKAQIYINETEALKNSISEINGTLEERRAALIAKQAEITQKREGVKELIPDFVELEKDNLHIEIVNTPDSISSLYAAVLNTATKALNEIFNEMVEKFDAIALGLYNDVQKVKEDLDKSSGSLEELKVAFENLLEKAKAIETEMSKMDAPFEELGQFKLQYKPKMSPIDVRGKLEQIIAKINHKIASNEGAIIKENKTRRINEYNQKSNEILNIAKEFEDRVSKIDGSQEEKQSKLFALEAEINEKVGLVDTIIPIY